MGTKYWLNKAFLTYLLDNSDDTVKNTNILDFQETQFDIESGNNYFGDLFRVKVKYINGNSGSSPQVDHLFIKIPKPGGFTKSVMLDGKFVEKEFLVYKRVLPLMLETKPIEFAAKFYPSNIPNILVLKDLKEEGYVMCDRLKRLDFEHTVEVIKTIANFHAISFAAHKRNPEVIEAGGKNYLYSTASGPHVNIIYRSLKNVCDSLESWKGYETFATILRRKLDTHVERYVDTFKESKNLNVLNHGDIWTANVLFKYDTAGHIMDTKLVDFQICKYGSPAIDLHYLFWTSTINDVHTIRYDELCSLYLYTLNTQLKFLGCEERLTEEQLKEELCLTLPTALFATTYLLPCMLMDPDNPQEINESDYYFKATDDGDDPLKAWGSGKYYQSQMKSVLTQLESKGILK